MNRTRIGLVVAGILALSLVGRAQSHSLIDAPLPADVEAAQPGDPSGGSMGVFPVQRVPEFSDETPRLKALDWSMLGASAALRVLDYASTEKALTQPLYFHEAVLPRALVENKPGFAAFQAGTVVLNYEAYRLLVRHRMRSLARVSQYMYVGGMTFQVAHNYQLLGQVPAK